MARHRHGCDRAEDQHSYSTAQVGAEGSWVPCGQGSGVRLVMAVQGYL